MNIKGDVRPTWLVEERIEGGGAGDMVVGPQQLHYQGVQLVAPVGNHVALFL